MNYPAFCSASIVAFSRGKSITKTLFLYDLEHYVNLLPKLAQSLVAMYYKLVAFCYVTLYNEENREDTSV